MTCVNPVQWGGTPPKVEGPRWAQCCSSVRSLPMFDSRVGELWGATRRRARVNGSSRKTTKARRRVNFKLSRSTATARPARRATPPHRPATQPQGLREASRYDARNCAVHPHPPEKVPMKDHNLGDFGETRFP